MRVESSPLNMLAYMLLYMLGCAVLAVCLVVHFARK